MTIITSTNSLEEGCIGLIPVSSGEVSDMLEKRTMKICPAVKLLKHHGRVGGGPEAETEEEDEDSQSWKV